MSRPAPSPSPRSALAIHATAVLIGEGAVILRGASGAGKSTLAMSLVEAARARRCFARLIGDDRLLLRQAGARLIVASHPAIVGRIERRYVGIAAVPYEEQAVARLVVDLLHPDAPDLMRMPGRSDTRSELLGTPLPRLALPAGHVGAVEAIFGALADLRR